MATTPTHLRRSKIQIKIGWAEKCCPLVTLMRISRYVHQPRFFITTVKFYPKSDSTSWTQHEKWTIILSQHIPVCICHFANHPLLLWQDGSALESLGNDFGGWRENFEGLCHSWFQIKNKVFYWKILRNASEKIIKSLFSYEIAEC